MIKDHAELLSWAVIGTLVGASWYFWSWWDARKTRKRDRFVIVCSEAHKLKTSRPERLRRFRAIVDKRRDFDGH